MTCHKCANGITSREQPSPLFDNPLRREFLPLEEVARFLGHAEAWVLHRVNEGILPCYQVGKTQRFFHVADIRDAILQNTLALQGGNHDQKDYKKRGKDHLRGTDQEEWPDSLQELREQKRSSLLGD